MQAQEMSDILSRAKHMSTAQLQVLQWKRWREGGRCSEEETDRGVKKRSSKRRSGMRQRDTRGTSDGCVQVVRQVWRGTQARCQRGMRTSRGELDIRRTCALWRELGLIFISVLGFHVHSRCAVIFPFNQTRAGVVRRGGGLIILTVKSFSLFNVS